MSGAVKEFKRIKADLKEKEGDWKSKFSGAFNSEQIFFSLFVLGIFYVVYTTVNGYYLNRNAKHEGDIIGSCYCKASHQSFYRDWFIICCGLWLILHCYTCFAVRFPPSGNFLGCMKIVCLPHNWPKHFKNLFKSCYNYCHKQKDSNKATGSSSAESNTDLSNKNVNRIVQHFIEVLWFQYYKLYVVGYAKGEDKKIDLHEKHHSDNEHSDTAKENSSDKKNKETITCICCCCSAAASAYNYIEETIEGSIEKQAHKCACGLDKRLGMCVSILRSAYYSFLLLVKFLAQLVTLPLLFLQIFDTYSLLCFSPELFCATSSVYKLHLAQAAITLLFYCSLAISQLASTMLTWNPWPKENDEMMNAKSEDTNNNVA